MQKLFLNPLFFFSFASAHSHLECTNVQNTTTGDTCSGFARYYAYNKAGYEGTAESKDRNYVVPPGAYQCPLPPAAQAYDAEYKMATVKPGQELTIQWPPRGHQNQPSSPVWIYCQKQGLIVDDMTAANQLPSVYQKSDLEELASFPYAGNNCQGSDVSWAKCYGSFEIPTTWESDKVYSCLWVWELSGARYVDCFELMVSQSANGSGNSTTLQETETNGNSNETNLQVSPIQDISEVDTMEIEIVIDDLSYDPPTFVPNDGSDNN